MNSNSYESGRYKDLRENFLFMLGFVDPDDLLEFWRDLGNDVMPMLIEAETKRTKVRLFFDNPKLSENSINSWAYRSGEI